MKYRFLVRQTDRQRHGHSWTERKRERRRRKRRERHTCVQRETDGHYYTEGVYIGSDSDVDRTAVATHTYLQQIIEMDGKQTI